MIVTWTPGFKRLTEIVAGESKSALTGAALRCGEVEAACEAATSAQKGMRMSASFFNSPQMVEPRPQAT